MGITRPEKMARVEKMLATVEECDNGLKRRSEGRFRPKSLSFAIDPRMVAEVRGWFDDMAASDEGDENAKRFDACFQNLGEYVRITFTPHLDGSVYVMQRELGRIKTLCEQCASFFEGEVAPAPVYMPAISSSAEAAYA